MTKLHTRIQFIKGVGPKIAVKLNKLGIETVHDLLSYYPRTYIDFSSITKINEITKIQGTRYKQYSSSNDQVSDKVTIRGRILGITNKQTSRRKFTVTEAVVEDGTGSIKVVWFNQPFLLKMLPAGREVILNGKIAYNFYSKEVVMESPERSLYFKIEAIYGETAGLTSRYLGKLVLDHRSLISDIEDWLPNDLIESYNLLAIDEALLNIHFPKSLEILERARQRIAFDELFLISLRANLSKEEIKKEMAPVILKDDEKSASVSFISSFPFELTGDQKKATEQILNDMNKNVPMNRLLNGDVGSGKTAVAVIASYVAVKAGYRVAIMVPTSILANQHYETFCKLFENENISIGLYTRERKEYFACHPVLDTGSSNYCIDSGSQIAGRNDSKNKLNSELLILNSGIIIGTQALIQEGISLENLGLVIVDEQHRFGVKQRGALLKLRTDPSGLTADKKMKPHFLSMTATPIPRTLHLSLFGDLDISLIREKPANRKEIKTRFVEPHNREKAYQFIRAHIKAGHQCFVICPLIEESGGSLGVIPAKAGIQKNYSIDSGSQTSGRNDNLSLFEDERKTVKREYEKLQTIFPEYTIGMLHGKMKAKEKDEIMNEFCNNRLNILVSTSVVEVGVDVPNATVMVIEDAERFGLAQIHQFRGRVGRAEHQSFCFLFSSTMSQKALERLKALESTSDGFRLAEIDLEQRGPGAVFGTEQSGLLDLKMASFSDRELIEKASNAAKLIIKNDPELINNPLLKQKIADYLLNKHLE